ncbi:MAG: hypothetical protein Q8O92_01960 [Candidatus Latescibacter sp.]|nr:hypothetical protein [Candidatus Latescibacter sp.]
MWNSQCVFCEQTIEKISHNGIYNCSCQNCGKYNISLEASQDLPSYNSTYGEIERKYKGKNHLFSGYIREMNELNRPIGLITNKNYESMLSSPMIPKTTMEKLDKLLLHIYRKTEHLYKKLDIYDNIPAIAYAKNSEELIQMLRALRDLNYLILSRSSNSNLVSLTIDGIQRAENLQKEVVNSTQCFVAMCFSPEMLEIYNKYIMKAVEETDYKPLNISQKEHNDNICDQIIAEIRKSKFLIADFTGNRGGVYFEAGFALGLGLPVIYTCKKADLEVVHFDVNHYNIIVWETGDELYERLKYRIQATII